MQTLRVSIVAALLHAPAWQAGAQELRPEAQLHFDRGVAAVDARDYSRAASEFEAAAAIQETAKVLYNAGTCLVQLGRRARALAAFERVEDLGSGVLPPASRENLTRQIAELRPLVALLTVHTNVAEASVTVDGRLVSRQPYPIEPGAEAAILVRREGHREARTTVRPSAPGPFEISLMLEPEPRAPIPVPPAAVAVRAEDQAQHERVVEPIEAPPPPASARQPPETGGMALWPWIVAGAVVVAAGAGIGIWAATSGNSLDGDYFVGGPR